MKKAGELLGFISQDHGPEVDSKKESQRTMTHLVMMIQRILLRWFKQAQVEYLQKTGEQWASQLGGQSATTPEDWARGVAQLVGVAAVRQPLVSRKRLQFDPFLGRRKPKPKVIPTVPGMAHRAQITDLKVKFEKFKGPKKKDPDCHVAEFEAAWQASGLAGVYGDADKMHQFEATFGGKAIEWFSHFCPKSFLVHTMI